MLLNNRYRAIQNLGNGGFGETFLAEDTQMPSHRRCVIKLLKPITENPQIYQIVQERFQREAAILEELGGSHNQIPALYAYFQQDGQFYLVQEYIEGTTLTSKVRQKGFFSENEVQELLANLLPILDFIHGKRIIHRDIKPDNIIVRHQDNKPVLIDFGAVRELMGTVINSQGSTKSSIVIGTPGYMPSEQAAGRPIYSSDLYSLGITAIYLLTGKQPQELETNPQTGEIVWQEHLSNIHHNINPKFIALIDRAIAYHPRDRFANAREMLDALIASANSIMPTQYPYLNNPTSISDIAATEHLIQSNKSASNGDSRPQKNDHQNIVRGGLIGVGLVGGLVIAGVVSINIKQPSSPTALTTNTPQESLESPTLAPQPIDSSPSPSASISNSISNNQTWRSPTNEEDNDYSWLSERAVTDADLEGKSALELDIMRNSIFARLGRGFETPGLQSYFNQQPWYTRRYSPQEFDKLKRLSNLEMRNVMYIKKHQTRFNLLHFR
ncbi:protein kinase domain-containing protein [Calothrix sp. UHCC 0171]|uniref:protein kinase domain-containing protein n=1 Tax=Calothrix sp. UHCC 0171 TaxID=3110245 RepID=UPI002B212A58|nr:protein kinase [Calothrix sp. UHCC 0171]MEA5572958.1 protein kinase [Calothrix sp. UHCC 0171]